jgi:hypothetical protein
MLAGMNVLRANMSHGAQEEHAETIRSARAASPKSFSFRLLFCLIYPAQRFAPDCCAITLRSSSAPVSI